MIFREDDIRNAFKAGFIKGKHQSYFDAPLDEDEYIVELKKITDISGEVCDHPYEYLSFGEDGYCECEKCNTRLS